MMIHQKAFYMLLLSGILFFPAFSSVNVWAQTEAPLKTGIPLPYPGYDPDRDKAIAECTRRFMPTKGLSADQIVQSDGFKFTPGLARQIQDCITKKGYQYNSPTAAIADSIPDAEKRTMSREQKEYYGFTREDIEGAGMADPASTKGNAISATVKPVPMLPVPDDGKTDSESKKTEAGEVEEKDVKPPPGVVLPPVNQRQPVFVEPESPNGSSGKPIFLEN